MAADKWTVELGPRLERKFRLAWLALKRRGQTTRIIREDDEHGVYEDDAVLPFRELKAPIAAAMQAIGERFEWHCRRGNVKEIEEAITQALRANPLEVFDERPKSNEVNNG